MSYLNMNVAIILWNVIKLEPLSLHGLVHIVNLPGEQEGYRKTPCQIIIGLERTTRLGGTIKAFQPLKRNQ